MHSDHSDHLKRNNLNTLKRNYSGDKNVYRQLNQKKGESKKI